MAVTSEGASKRYRGLSTDIKPGRTRPGDGAPERTPPVGSTFTETDTGARFVWTGSWPWERQEQTIEPLLRDINESIQELVSQMATIIRGHEEHLWEEPAPPE